MALEIEVHAGAELIRAYDGVDHAHHLRAFLVDGGRVEIVDLAVAAWAHGMGERALVFWELERAERAHLGNALHRAGALVGRELMVAIDRQPFLQAQLEPVPASDSIASPIVE